MPHHPAIHPDDEFVQAEHDFNFLIARHLADKQARLFGATIGRRGDAHQLLLAGHMHHLFEGMGEAAAFAFMDRLMEEFAASCDERRATRLAMRASRKNG